MVYKSEKSHRNLYERVKQLLVSDEWSDCCFSINGKEFKAHRLILGISSPVFEAMFYGPLSSDNVIDIIDIEPEIFQLLLNYIYTDKVEIASIDQAFQLLYASRKYILEHLTNVCIDYILANISVDNVIDVLNYPDYLQEPQLVSYALKLFCEHASYLLDEYKDIITIACMRSVLESNNINIREIDLLKQLFSWMTSYCKQNDIPNTYESRKDLLMNEGLLMLLRFNTLTLSDLDDLKRDTTCLLYPQELELIKSKILNCPDTTKDNALLNRCSVPRKPLKLQWYFCHRNPIKSTAPFIVDSNNSTVHCRIKTNKSIFINSLCIPTRLAPIINFHSNIPIDYSEQLCVSIVSEGDNNVVKFTNFMNTVEYDSVVDIELSEPCFIKKNKWYKITFAWPENRFETYSYVVELRDMVYNGFRTKIEFEDSASNICGSFLEGLKFCL